VLLLAACGGSRGRIPIALKPSTELAVISRAEITSASTDRLTLTFDAAVNVENDEFSGIPDVSGFTLAGSANAHSATELLSGNGKMILNLQLDGAASAGETITLSYNGVRLTTTVNGKNVESFSGFPVSNGTSDTIPPTLVSATISAASPAELVLVFSEPLKAMPSVTAGSMLGFGITSIPGGLGLAGAPYVLLNDTLTLSLSQNAAEGQTVSLSYSGATVKDAADNPLGPINDVEVFAIENQVPNTWTVQFDWNSAAGEGSDGPMTPSRGTPITLPTAGTGNTRAKAGYTHAGWTDDNGATTKAKGTSYTPDRDITLTAVWTPVTYNIYYWNIMANNAANPPTYNIATPEITFASPPGVGSMIFDGWYSESSLTNPVTAIPLGSTGDRHFYAKWMTVTYTASYDGNGQTSADTTVPASQTVNAGTVIALPMAVTMLKTDKILTGWTEGSTGGTLYGAGAAYPVTGDVTFYAKWIDIGIITVQPQGRDYGLSEPATALSVTASGASLTYAWYKDGAPGSVLGTGSTYTPPVSAAGSTADYYVVVTNTVGSATATETSAAATVRYRTLKERVADNAGKTAAITLYQDESFAAVAAANITGANTRITLVGGDSVGDGTGFAERTVTLNGTGYMFYISGGASLSMGDNVTLQGAAGNNTTALVGVEGSSLAMSGTSKIIGNTSSGTTGGGVSVRSVTSGMTTVAGSFTMSGGTISGNSVNPTGSYGYGGGVYVGDTSSFTMSGGTISGNSAATTAATGNISWSGGGVYFSSSGKFEMSGTAAIKDNTTSSLGTGNSSGGGVYSSGIFTMSGGAVISGNIAGGTGSGTKSGGGGVFFSGNSFTMSDSGGAIPDIYKNTASVGGGVRIQGGNFIMNSSRIGGASDTDSANGNIATVDGGGVYVGNGSFTMLGSSTIRCNTAGGSGGGVSFNSIAGNFTMAGNVSSRISYNTATGGNGGGVNFASSGYTLVMTAGYVLGNKAAAGKGGGVYVSAGSFVKTGGIIYGVGSTDTNKNVATTAGTSKGDAVYSTTISKYRDTQLLAADNISTADTSTNWN
jgi:uncharacterized repeat protein (TIGR02543 family)